MARVNEGIEESSNGGACDLIDPLARSVPGLERGLIAPLVVAVDGSRASGAALRVAAALAARDNAYIEAILVEGIAPSRGGTSLSARALRREHLPPTTRLGRVSRQLCAILDTNRWQLNVEFGSFGPSVANLARSAGASLIVMGLSQHRSVRRLLGKGAVARVQQSAQTPVLAVTATARELPHVAVAAIDFSPASLRAAHAARDLLARPATLYLAHVRPTDSESLSEQQSWDAVYGEGVALQLKQLAADLTTDGVNVVPWIALGVLSETLLKVAGDTHADLIACGAHAMSTVERILLGEVPLRLLRDAKCSLLIASSLPPLDTSETSP